MMDAIERNGRTRVANRLQAIPLHQTRHSASDNGQQKLLEARHNAPAADVPCLMDCVCNLIVEQPISQGVATTVT